MTLVRERRHQQPLRVSLPPTSTANTFRPWFHSPSSLSSRSTNSPGIDCLESLEKLAVLGQGNSGTVYKVCHRQTSAIYTLKVIRFREDHCGTFQEQAIREADILQRVDSGFVVMCYGVFENGFVNADGCGGICFIMEYMEGGSLHDHLNKHQKLSEDAISSIARGVLEGLHYLHGMQIVHRDIKPSNLLINSKGEIKIADFGISTIVEGKAKDNDTTTGTWAYMSPERIDPERWGGDDSDGFAGDVWALGLVVIECCIGRFPLINPRDKPDWVTLIYAICYDEMAIPETASRELQNFTKRCLVRDWRERATISELLSHPFVTKFQRKLVSHSY